MNRFLCLLLPAVFYFSGPIEAATVQLAPSRDNTLHQRSNPAQQTSNALGDIFIGRTNQDGQGPPTVSIRRGLIYFDIAGSVPASATITGVTMAMRDAMGLNGDHPADLHRLLADWGEGTSFFAGGQGASPTENDATWLYRFYHTATPASSVVWSNPGGDFDPTISGTALITDDLEGGQTFTWPSSAGMIADVQSWLDNPTSNYGWLIRGNEAQGQTAKRLSSRESAFPPLLTITYTQGNSLPPIPEPNSLSLLLAGLLCVVRRRRRPKHYSRHNLSKSANVR